ncbi:hypothetical protein COT51_02855 [candidate division WWE3 bacterium CG08_land_8_20_14_0_20_41_15]|uniref:Uncharacterized protein n=1 Tax=candidate division WWE3 bacterium CG08_land_8_20_14_0_20_41_15 TaxID=1975086 RepID=A0A2H0X922_UNCKA|nr:MAG: hypothetical protein COT51_02855 [candidate division WWE3 bacterium CG08_land_8_20_14_0_20_41_15]
MNVSALIVSLPVPLCGLIFGLSVYNLDRAIRFSSGNIYKAFLILAISVIVFLSFTGIFALFIKETGKMLIYFISLIFLYMTGSFSFNLVGFLSALMLLVGLFIFSYMVRGNLDRYVAFDKVAILHGSGKKMVFFLALVIAVNFYFVYQPVIEKNGFKLPEKQINSLTSMFYKELEKYVGAQFSKETELLRGANLGNAKISEEGRVDLSGLVPETTAKAMETINGYIEPYAKFIPVVVSISIFFTSVFVSGGLSMLSIILSSMLIFLYTKFGIMKIGKVMKEVERPELT